MAELIYILLAAGQLACFAMNVAIFMAVRKSMRTPRMAPIDYKVPKKRVVTTPTGEFTIDEGGKRMATINDDESVWRRENNQG